MIKRRLEESGSEEHEEGRWPATFCLGSRCGAEIQEREKRYKGGFSQVADGRKA